MGLPIVVVRLVLSAVLIVSAVAKWRDRGASREAVAAFGVPRSLTGAVAFALPVVETCCAVLLLFGDPFATVGAVLALTMLATFTVGIVVNLARGNRPECRCFGALSGTEPIGWRSVVRNVVLMALAAVPLLDAGDLRSVAAELSALPTSEAVLLAVAGLLATALAVMAYVLRELVRRYGQVLLRLDTLEQMAGIAEPKDAPDFLLLDPTGAKLIGADLLSPDSPTMLVFVSPTCHNCAELVPELASWQHDEGDPIQILAVSDGQQDEIDAKFGDSGLRVLRQNGWTVAEAFQVEGTPAAVLVGADGRVAAAPAHGADRVREMHQRLLDAMTQHQNHGGQEESVHAIGRRPVSPGDAVPDVLVKTDDSGPQPLAEAVSDDTVLLFWRTTCGFCAGILDEVRDSEDHIDLRLVTDSSLEDVRSSGLNSRLLRDSDGSLNSALQVPGTPSAIWVRNGTLMSPLAVGGPATLDVLKQAAAASSQGEPEVEHDGVHVT